MRRYLVLWSSFFRASLLADTEYRLNIVLRVLGEVIWYVAQMSLFEVLYIHTRDINGWSVHAVRIFQASFFLVDNLYMVLFSENLESLTGIVRTGDLDLYLTKPVNSQFMLSCRKISVSYLPNTVLILGYLVWAVRGLPNEVGFGAFVIFAVTLAAGLIFQYAMSFFMSGTLVVFLQDVGNVQYLWHSLFRLASKPDSFFPSPLRWLILTVVPVGFIASVPARALTEPLTPALVWSALPLSLGWLWASGVTWTRAMRKYASSSS